MGRTTARERAARRRERAGRRGPFARRMLVVAAALPVVGALALAIAVREGAAVLPADLSEAGDRLSRDARQVVGEAAIGLAGVLGGAPRPTMPPSAVVVPPTIPVLPAAPAAPRLSRGTMPGAPRRLLAGGCCPGAWWSADSATVLYIDRPAGAPVTALYGVDAWPPGAQGRVVDREIGRVPGAMSLRVEPQGNVSVVRDSISGERWTLPTDGNPLLLSPDGARAVWWEATGGRADVDGLNRVWTAAARGGEPVELASLWGLRVVEFLPDSIHVLVLGRPFRERPLYSLLRLNTLDGDMVELARGEWLAEPLLSPDGRWVAYLTSLDRANPTRNGVWLAPTQTDSYGAARKLDVVGAYRWRTGSTLAYVPFGLDVEGQELWQLDADTGATRLLLAADLGIRIAGNDWSISPDGGSMAWLDERERDLWLVDLP